MTLATSDYYEVQVYQDSGGDLNLQSTAESTLVFFAYTVD